MIGEIKLKCRKKNISNRRELLPVVLAKMLSRCSVRIHGCTGSPADYPNTMLSWRVLGKLSWFYSLRGRSCSAQFWPPWLSCPLFLWVGRSPSQSLAGHPFRHSCSISQLFCQRLWGMFKCTASEEEKPSSTLNDMAWVCPVKIFLGTVWQRTWEVASTYSPSCLLRPTELTPPSPKRPPPASHRAVTLYRLSSPEQAGWELHTSYFCSHPLMLLTLPKLTSHFDQGSGIYHSTIENTGWKDPTWQMPFGTNSITNHQWFTPQGSQTCFHSSCPCNDALLHPLSLTFTLVLAQFLFLKLFTTGSLFSPSRLCPALYSA